jgi:hypothetical protein
MVNLKEKSNGQEESKEEDHEEGDQEDQEDQEEVMEPSAKSLSIFC